MPRKYTNALREHAEELNCHKLFFDEMMKYFSEDEIKEFVKHFNQMYDSGRGDEIKVS